MKLGLAAVVTLLLLMRRFDAAGMRQHRSIGGRGETRGSSR
jgi:hypothetical protein